MKKLNAEQMFQSNSPSVLSIDGNAVKALKIACDKFLESGKDIREFIITISEETENKNTDTDIAKIYMVTFMGKLSPGKRGLGTANRAPGSVTYFISREKLEIFKEQGVK